MLFLFRKPKIFFFFASPLWVALVILGRFTIFTEFDSTVSGIVSPIIAALAGIYLIYYFCVLQASKIHRAYNDILSDECDPERYVAIYEPIREAGKNRKSTVYLTESSYAMGLHLLGKSEEAREIAVALTERSDFARRSAVDRADAFVDVGIYSVSLGDLTAARDAIAKAQEILDGMTVGTQDYSRIFREVSRLTHRANIADGIYDEALEYFTDTSREYTIPYSKVNRMHTLAQIYRAKGDTERLRKALTYVANHGGTLKIAKDAREELLTLPEPEEKPVIDDEDDD